jgi:hypothetical protein
MKKQLTLLTAILVLLNACRQPAPDAAVNPFDEAAEKAAIMKTIEEETACYFKQDYECWKETYAQTEYAFQAWNFPDGTFEAKVGTAIHERVKKNFKENPAPAGGSYFPKIERRNMVVKFFGENAAYLFWDQYNLNVDSNKYYHSKDTRVMEKIDGKWRIVSIAAFWDSKNLIPVDSLK